MAQNAAVLIPPGIRTATINTGCSKMLIVNKNGTFIDGSTKISDTTIDDLHIDYSHPITLRFSNPEDTRNPGGFTIFGAGFGNHNQSIKAKLLYE